MFSGQLPTITRDVVVLINPLNEMSEISAFLKRLLGINLSPAESQLANVPWLTIFVPGILVVD